MKKFLTILLVCFMASFAFAQREEVLLKSDVSASLSDYDYATNFKVESQSGWFNKDSLVTLAPNELGFRVMAIIPESVNCTTYDIVPSYPSFLNEPNIGAGYIENVGDIKKISITLTVNRPYDEIILMYSTSPLGDIKLLKMPQDFNKVATMEETTLELYPDSYIDDVNKREIKSPVALGSECDGIYFRGIRIKANKAPSNIEYSPYSIVCIKEIKVQYDYNILPEQYELRKSMENEYGTNKKSEKIKEKTIAKIEMRNKSLEAEKRKMSDDNNTK